MSTSGAQQWTFKMAELIAMKQLCNVLNICHHR